MVWVVCMFWCNSSFNYWRWFELFVCFGARVHSIIEDGLSCVYVLVQEFIQLLKMVWVVCMFWCKSSFNYWRWFELCVCFGARVHLIIEHGLSCVYVLVQEFIQLLEMVWVVCMFWCNSSFNYWRRFELCVCFDIIIMSNCWWGPILYICIW